MKATARIFVLFAIFCLVFAAASFAREPFEAQRPLGQNHFVYSGIVQPVVPAINTMPVPLIKPIGLGEIRKGFFDFRVSLPKFEGPVDIFLALALPSQEIYLILPDNSIELLFEAGTVPWKKGVWEPVKEHIFSAELPFDIPWGRYTFYLLVILSEDTSFQNYFLWETYFEVDHTNVAETALVSINYPEPTMRIGSMLTAEILVSNPHALSSITFLLDSTPIETQVGIPSEDSYIVRYDTRSIALQGTHTFTVQAESLNGQISNASIPVIINWEIRRQAIELLRKRNVFCCDANVSRWRNLPIVLLVNPEVYEAIGIEMVEAVARVWTMYTGITFEVIAGKVNHINDYYNRILGMVVVAGTSSLLQKYPQVQSDGSAGANQKITDPNDIRYFEYAWGILALRLGNSYNYHNLMCYELGNAIVTMSLSLPDTLRGTKDRFGCLNGRVEPVAQEATKILYFELLPGDSILNYW